MDTHEAFDPFAYQSECKYRDDEWGKVGISDMPWLSPCLNEQMHLEANSHEKA